MGNYFPLLANEHGCVSKSMNFITFDKDGKIVCDNVALDKLADINYKVKIYSIVGQARMGKSTLLNMFCSEIMNTDYHIFETDSSDEHCTKGINISICKPAKSEIGYVFVDCQGINHHDSSNDAKLLLLPYLLSDVIIFNDTALNNTTLKSLEPLLSMCNHVDLNGCKVKPDLVIRVKDYYLETPIEIALKNLLAEQNDQYQSIRNTISTLFENISAVSTDIIDKKTIGLLNNKKYLDVVNSEFGFKKVVDLVLNSPLKREVVLTGDYTDKIKSMINDINNNKKIDYTKFDTYSLLIKNDLNEFLNGIDKRFYLKIDVTCDQSEYDGVIMERKKKCDLVIKKFNETFTKIDPTIKQQYLDKISKDIYQPVNDAIKNLTINATEFANDGINLLLLSRFNDLNSLMNFDTYQQCLKDGVSSFLNNASILQGQIFDKLNRILINNIKELSTIYEPVYQEKVKYLEDELGTVKELSIKWLNMLAEELNRYNNNIVKYVSDVVCNYDTFELINVTLTRSYNNNITRGFFIDKANEYIHLLESTNSDQFNDYKLEIDDIKIKQITNPRSLLCALYNCTNLGQQINNKIDLFLNTPESKKKYEDIVLRKIEELSKTDIGNSYLIEHHLNIIKANKFLKVVKIFWNDIGKLAGIKGFDRVTAIKLNGQLKIIANDSEFELFWGIKNAENAIMKYVGICNSTFTSGLIKDLFCYVVDEITIYDFSVNMSSHLKKLTSGYVLDQVDGYYIKKYIDKFK